MTVTEKFLRYVKVDTQASPTTGMHPSTNKQFDLANMLVEELHALGVNNARVDEHCYVYAHVDANVENAPALGFIAHLDTEPVCSGKNVQPHVFTYTGGDITLKNGKQICVSEFPFLNKYVGKNLIVTDGNTLLGADDKAGIAAIMAMVAHLQAHPEIKHGKIGIAFTPDEEIGEGASLFDVKGFGCDFAYTLDGGFAGDLGWETFNAAEAVVSFVGKNIHPGYAKGKMVNCALIAGDFLAALPPDEIPAKTADRQGFYHVEYVKAEVESGEIALIIRDHDMQTFQARKAHVESICKMLADEYGQDAVRVRIRDQYFNCREVIKEHFHLIENARKAYEQAGLTVSETPVRGGTDGCKLSFMGLPCPNLFTGGHNAHSVREFAVVEQMEKAVEVALHLIDLYAKA